MTKEEFLTLLGQEISSFNEAVSTEKGDWTVKGFIDIAKNIYTISADTKVVSKIIELLLLPEILKFAEKYKLKVHLAEYQNHYPDLTFIDGDDNLFALDLKTTYRMSSTQVNGMTLGAFTGYFRDRESTKNISFPYKKYTAHIILGLIYTQVQEIEEGRVYSLKDLESITSVIKDFVFFVQEKYKIASDRPGSGNTKNIGSVRNIDKLIHGDGPFSALGEEIFDDYWMYYLTTDMARAIELKQRPYTNLVSYDKYKGLKK